ncbi:MAG: type II secretion system inner membrane protein GspF [Thermodesulfobacteriota bacterium]
MPLFRYTGFSASGRKVAGGIEAGSRRGALAQLRDRGIVATELLQQSGAENLSGRRSWLPARPRIGGIELAGATRQLATLLAAGIPLDSALATVAGQEEQATLTTALEQVRQGVLQGQALHQGLGEFPRVFSEFYVNMVRVGEASGTLDKVMYRLADFLEDQARLRSRIQAALAYPLLMAVVSAGVLVFLLAFVVPKVTRMLVDIGRQLPLPTRILMGGSDLLAAWWWLLLLIVLGAAFAGRRYLASEAGRLRADRFKLTAPLFGKLYLYLATARFSRTLATLLQSGVGLLTALEIVRNLLPNRVLQRVFADTAVAVREGEGLATPLERSGVLPKMVAQMAAVGEKSGELEAMLFKVAEAYEHRVETATTTLLSLLEPAMILVMGAVVGFIVLAVLLPIFEASQGLG